MRVGSLVTVNRDIEEYVDVLGNTVGFVVNLWEGAIPELCEVMWSNGDFERLYADELEVVRAENESR